MKKTAAIAMLCGVAVAAYAAGEMLIGHRYDLTGTMTKDTCSGDLMMKVPAGRADATVRVVPSLGVNLDTVYGTLKPDQKATASGIYLGEIQGAGSDSAVLPTLRADRLVPVAPTSTVREERFRSLYELRRR